MGLLDGKVAIITGAGGGLGRAHALALAAEGADIVVNDLAKAREGEDKRPAELVCDEVRALGRKAAPHYEDIASEEGAASLIETAKSEFGRLDILVNNAGILRDKTLKKLEPADFDIVMKVHVRGTYLCSRAAAHAFAEQGEGGRIINTSSIAGLKGNFGQTNYSAAKAGIYGITRTTSMELARDEVTVNAIAPIAKTAMTEDIDAVDEELTPELVSPMVVFLASDLAKDVTGRVFGCHGNHFFEYEVKMSNGVKRGEAWTATAVADELAEIGRWAKPAPAGGGGAGTPAELVEAALMNIEKAFKPEKAAGWNAVFHFVVDGAGEYGLTVADGKVSAGKGEPEGTTCKVTVDVDTMAGMIDGSVDGNQAFMNGKIKASKLPDLGKFGKAFKFEPDFVASLKGGGGGGPQGPDALVAATFENIHLAFRPEKAAGWDAVMVFETGGEPRTVRIKDGKVSTEAGAAADATCTVTTDVETMAGMIDGSVDGNQAFMNGKIKASKLPDLGKFGKAFKFDAAFLEKLKSGGGGAAPAADDGKVSERFLERMRAMIEALPETFDPDKAKGYKGNLWFEVEGGDDFAVLLDDGACDLDISKPEKVACTISTDVRTLSGLFDGSIKGEDALKQKKLAAKPPTGMIKFRQAFTLGEALMAHVDEELREAEGGAAGGAPAPEAEEGDGLVNPKAVGKGFRGPARFATSEDIVRYAEATGDPNPRYQEAAGDDQVGSPLFPVTFVMDLFMEAMTDKDLGIDMTRVVHGEQRIKYLKPIRRWDLINPRAKVQAITEKSSGWLVDVAQTLYCEGEPVVEMVSGIFIRGYKKSDKPKGEAAQPEALPEPKFSFDQTVDADQSERYAKASGDTNPIHLDAEFAKSVGLPDRILHGLCTMAMAGRAVVEEALGGDPTRLKGLQVRFSKPVLMGDTLTTNIWEVARNDRDVTLGFEVKTQRGEVVLTNGLAEVLD